MANFLRQATLRVPVSPTSASNQFPMPDTLIGVPYLTFFFVNANPFDVRLEGTLVGGSFVQVTEGTGWLVFGREKSPIYGSKMPAKLSAMAVSTSGNSLPDAGFDYTNCWIELVYGRGSGR